MNANVIIPILIGLIVLAVLGWNYYKRTNPTGTAALEVKAKADEDAFKKFVTDSLTALHIKADNIHQATLAPVTVALLPAGSAPVAVLAPAAAPAADPPVAPASTLTPDHIALIQATTGAAVAAVIASTKPSGTMIGYVAPGDAKTVVFDPALGPEAFATLYAQYPVGTNFVSPANKPLDNRGVEVPDGQVFVAGSGD